MCRFVQLKHLAISSVCDLLFHEKKCVTIFHNFVVGLFTLREEYILFYQLT